MPILVLALLLASCSSSTIKQSTASNAQIKQTKVDRKKISSTIFRHRSYLSQCYGKALTNRGNAKLKGVIFVQFSIGPDGKAISPEVIAEKSTLKNDELNKCLFAGLTSWDFPVHPEGEPLFVRYPFRFHDAPPKNMQNKLDQFQNLKTK